MNKKRKTYELSEDDILRIEKIKKDQNLRTDVSAIRYVLKEYENRMDMLEKDERLALRIVDLLEERNYVYKERLRWATSTAEKNSTIMLDVLNTLLFAQEITECIPVTEIPAPVIEKSKQLIQEKISHFKQKKDNSIYAKKA